MQFYKKDNTKSRNSFLLKNEMWDLKNQKEKKVGYPLYLHRNLNKHKFIILYAIFKIEF